MNALMSVNILAASNQVISEVVTPKRLTEKPIKILVVEDDKAQWPVWEHIFTTLGRESAVDWETSQDGAQALLLRAYQKNSPYDLVISDVYLEGQGTGMELWNKYGEAAEHFVFVTGKQFSQDDLNETLVYGSPKLVQKPISVAKGRELVKEALTEK